MKLLTSIVSLLIVGSAAAQNPTILQGSYITNVFGNSNFVLNPNAQTNTANVAVSNATVTRSTTTPLVATSEFNITTSTATGYADWSLRTFDAGMKGQNCEARFTYRGFSVGTTTAQILQGANVVAQLALTPSTDPRIASINFPCGDLSAVTKFRLQQASASLTGTNEISGIYTGLATNMANVAQAEFVGAVKWTATTNCQWLIGGNVTTYGNFAADADCTTPTGSNIEGQASAPSTKIPGVTFTNLKPGRYVVTASGLFQSGGGSGSAGGASYYAYFRFHDGTNAAKNENNTYMSRTTSNDGPGIPVITGEFEYSAAQSNVTIQIQGKTNSVSPNAAYAVVEAATQPLYISVYRFPSSSELVVTPERQNVWASAEWNNADLFQYFGVAEPTGFLSYTRSGSFTAVYNGSAQAPLSSTQVGFSVPNLPVGKYELRINQGLRAAPGITSGNSVVCDFRLRETTTNTPVGLAEQTTDRDVNLSSIIYGDKHVVGIFNNTSTGTRNFIYEANKLFDNNATNNGQCGLQTTVYLSRPVLFTLTPLDQPSNSALYVQGPVKAAETGAAISAGYVGEVITQTTATTTTATTGADTEIDITNANITVGVGVWDLEYFATVGAYRATTASSVFCRIRVIEGTSTNESGLEQMFGLQNNSSGISANYSTASGRKRITITSGTKTYKLRITSSVASAVGECDAYNGNISGLGITGDDASTYIRAVRVN